MIKIKIRSQTKKQILLLLAAGAALNLSQSPKRSGYILKQIPKELTKIKREYLYRLVKEFHHHHLVDYREENDVIKIVLSEDAKKQILVYSLDKLIIPTPSRWNGHWFLVSFDIPEKKRSGRDALRDKLKELGFYEWQKSVFIYPYPCRKEVDFIIEVFDLRPYVRIAEVINVTNEAELKLRFKLV
ncbi:MAG: hypothetical protein HYV76_02090 [Candidatus Vogelbacteria bacterium]|nr:hypothetical protein [Candidatus Vogelbacteria bacterium]